MLNPSPITEAILPETLRFKMALGPYLLKIADTEKEVAQAIHLRSRVFKEDFGAQCDPNDEYWDWGELDSSAFHLIVQASESGQVVGTYRLILSSSKKGFYSQSEFELSHFLALPGRKLELSRACIDPKARTGAVMALLWKGLAEFARRAQAKYLFGCSSLLTESADEVRTVLSTLEGEGMICSEYGVEVLPEYQMQDHGQAESPSASKTALPPLLALYLKAGAKVAPVPAHDRAFKCVDLLTVLDLEELNPFMAKRYGLNV